MSDVRTELYADAGPVADAAAILATCTTLADHVTMAPELSRALRIAHRTDDVPFHIWGDATQGLWRLLSSMVYTGEQVSLREVVSRLDPTNRAAVADALAAYCGVQR